MRNFLRLRHAPLLLLGCFLLLAPAANAWERLRGLDEHGTSRLMRVAAAGDTAAIGELLGRRLFRPDPDRAVPSADGRDLVAFLAFMQPRPDRRTGWTALHFAAAGGRVGTTRALLDAGADPNRVSRDGFSPLDVALLQGPWDFPDDAVATTRLLLDAGGLPGEAKLNGPVAPTRALAAGDTVLLRRLAGVGYDIHQPFGDGRTLLGAAATAGDRSAAEALLRLGADPTHRDEHGWTPGMRALQAGHDSIAALLGVTGTRDAAAVRAFSLVVAGDAAGLRRLLEQGPLPDARDERGRGLLELAVDTAGEAVALALLDGGAAIPGGRDGELLLNEALHHGWDTVLDRLFDAGVPLGEGAVAWAAYGGRVDLVKRVVEMGGRLNRDGPQLLFRVMDDRDPDTLLIRLLLEAGADPRGRNPMGASPMERVPDLHRKCPRCAELLWEHAARLDSADAGG